MPDRKLQTQITLEKRMGKIGVEKTVKRSQSQRDQLSRLSVCYKNNKVVCSLFLPVHAYKRKSFNWVMI